MTRRHLIAGGTTATSTTTPPPEPPPGGPWGPWLTTLNVNAGGSIQTALNAANALNAGAPAHPSNRAHRVRVAAGTYTEQLTAHPYLSIVGQGATPQDTVIQWFNPANSGQIRRYPLEVACSIHLQNLTLRGEYQSYAMHADANSSPGTPTQLVAEDCHFLNTLGHFAVGLGANAAQEMYFRRCIFQTNGDLAPFFGHNAPGQSAPSLVVLDECTLIGPRYGIQWSDLTSGQTDRFIITGTNTMNTPDVDVVLNCAGTRSIDARIAAPHTVTLNGNATYSRDMPAPLPNNTDPLGPFWLYWL